MADRYEANVVREKDGKSYWTKLGIMFPSKNGDGFTLYLDALPLAGADGQAKIVLTAPKPKDGGGNTGGGYSRQATQAPAFDSEIPFAPQVD